MARSPLRPPRRDQPPPCAVPELPERVVEDPRHPHPEVERRQAADGEGVEVEAVFEAGEGEPVAAVELASRAPDAVALVEDRGGEEGGVELDPSPRWSVPSRAPIGRAGRAMRLARADSGRSEVSAPPSWYSSKPKPPKPKSREESRCQERARRVFPCG